jgi:hypothetical protein
MNLKEIIDHIKNHPANECALIWLANNYSKLDLIKDLEALAEEKPYQASVCTECPDACRRKMIDDLFAEITISAKLFEKSPETP